MANEIWIFELFPLKLVLKNKTRSILILNPLIILNKMSSCIAMLKILTPFDFALVYLEMLLEIFFLMVGIPRRFSSFHSLLITYKPVFTEYLNLLFRSTLLKGISILGSVHPSVGRSVDWSVMLEFFFFWIYMERGILIPNLMSICLYRVKFLRYDFFIYFKFIDIKRKKI